jgi:tryptophan synthase alpha chain
MESMSVTTSSDVRGGLDGTFAATRAENRAALVLYTTAGRPSARAGLDVLRMLADEGADVIELGIPFSDPLADGPTIQRSSDAAIRDGVDLRRSLDLLSRFRAERDTPVVLFSYLNPLLAYGMAEVLDDAVGAGAQGVLVTDLPAGADPELERAFGAAGLDLIRLVAPTTTPTRVREIAGAASGFLYYVSRTGVTGVQAELAGGLEEEVRALRAVSPVPVAVGFGISTGAQARRVAAVADGVVVGSALVEALEREGVAGAARLVAELRSGVERHEVR